jgi:hypothetical protein
MRRISRSRATSDAAATSRCRFLDVDVVGSSPSAGPGTLDTVDAMGSASWRVGDVVGTSTWRADDAMGNTSMDATAATSLANNDMIHQFMQF